MVAKGVPTCTSCMVPINLCHCSRSCCGSCGLPAAQVAQGKTACECIARAPARSTVCSRCAEAEKGAQDAHRQSADLSKKLTIKERELEDLRRKLADARADAQAEREKRAKVTGKQAARIQELEAALCTVSATPSRELELERAAHLATQAAAAAEARCKAAEMAAARSREEANAARARISAAEDAARLASEGRLAYVAEAEAATETERQLRIQLDEAREALAANRSAAAKEVAAARKEQVEAARCCEEMRREMETLASQKENALAYEDAVAEVRRLRDECAAATQRAGACEARSAELEERVTALESERSQLQHSLAHAERVRELFASVTSHTKEVQQAASELLQKAEARKRAVAEAAVGAAARKEGSAEVCADGDEARDGASGGVPLAPREVWTAGAHGPLQPRQQAGNTNAHASGNGVWPPQPPPARPGSTRKGLAAGRPGVRSAFGSARS